MLLAFRLISAASTFSLLGFVPLLMSEILPAHLRGTLVDVHGIMIVLCYTIQGWDGFGFFFWTNGDAVTWRPLLAIWRFWPLSLLVGLLFIPESPRWLMMQGRDCPKPLQCYSNCTMTLMIGTVLSLTPNYIKFRDRLQIDQALRSS